MSAYLQESIAFFGLSDFQLLGWRVSQRSAVGRVNSVTEVSHDAGVEFLLPIAKWHGLGGAADMWGRSFETFTQAAALGALTKRTGLFVIAHVSLVTAAFAAKAIATVDHAIHGRAGLNIVCGWNPDEFSPHGVTLDGEHRYDRGLEWYLSRSVKAGVTTIDRVLAATLAGRNPQRFPGMFANMHPIIGTPDDVVAELEKIASVGVAGSTLVFLNYLQELPYFVQEVFPRLERKGLRNKFSEVD